MSRLLLFSQHSSNRLRYVMDYLFGKEGDWSISANLDDLEGSSGPTLVYGAHPGIHRAICLPDSGYLWQRKIGELPPSAHVSFPLKLGEKDLLAFLFFTLSRAEEYGATDRDAWGRFKVEHSLAYRKGLLDFPVADQIRLLLWQEIRRRWPAFSPPDPVFRRQITYDTDVAWAYRYRSLPRQGYGVLRDFLRGDLASLSLRAEVLRGRREDPYFTFPKILDFHRRRGDAPTFFWLMGNRGKVDRAVGLRSKEFRHLVRTIAESYTIGLHPTMQSRKNFSCLQEEYARLADLAGMPIHHSRQHYLVIDMPDTYRHLLALGIRNDYSMGYASRPGFRAGTCFPFPWYDCEKDLCTDLIIHPFQAMDATFWVYGRYAPAEVLGLLGQLETRCQEVGGTFTFIAHNSSFSGPGTWIAWENIFDSFVGNAAT